MLTKTPTVQRYKDVRSRLEQRMDFWVEGRFKALVDDAANECRHANRSGRHDVGLPEQQRIRARSLNHLRSGKLPPPTLRRLEHRLGGYSTFGMPNKWLH